MSAKPRTVKVFLTLTAAMTFGALVLLGLDGRPLSAGAFSLASYSDLNSIEQILSTVRESSPNRWDSIEIYYSNTSGGDIDQISSINGYTSSDDVNFHFLVCNGYGRADGFIESSRKWENQWSCISGGDWFGSGRTVRICVVGDGRENFATDSQLRRVNVIAENLSRRFGINMKNISYPEGWRF